MSINPSPGLRDVLNEKAKLKAENERLRKALDDISDYTYCIPGFRCARCRVVNKTAKAAREQR